VTVRRTNVMTSLVNDVAFADLGPLELAQRHAEDVVYAAARFKPNAAGNHELSWGGFGRRQILKADGAYLAERVVLAVTPLHVCVIELACFGRVERLIRRWPRASVTASLTVAHGRTRDLGWPALRIATHGGRTLADVQALRHDRGSELVAELLLSNGTAPS
jgi:hypothetical protein